MTGMPEAENRDVSKPAAWALGGIAVVIAGFAYWISYSAGLARIAFEEQRRNEIAEESRSTCERLGYFAGTKKHVDCIADLKTIRELHERRIMADTSAF
jgi:hypothetical protein